MVSTSNLLQEKVGLYFLELWVGTHFLHMYNLNVVYLTKPNAVK